MLLKDELRSPVLGVPALGEPCPAWTAVFPVACGAAAAAIGLTTLAGWIFGIPLLTSFASGAPSVKFNTGLTVIVIGAALALRGSEPRFGRRHRAIQSAALVTALFGLGILWEYVTGRGLGLDSLFFTEPPGGIGSGFPGRPSPQAAASFLLLGSALALLDERSCRMPWLPDLFALLVFLLSMLGLIGHLFGVPEFYELGSRNAVPFNSNLACLALAAGVMATRRDWGLMKLAAGSGAGGILFRRAFPFAIAVPLALGRLRIAGAHAGFYSDELGTALMMSLLVVILGAGIVLQAAALDREESERERARTARASGAYNRSLIEASLDPLVTIGSDGKITDVNAAVEGVTGWSRSILIGSDFCDYFTQPAMARAGYQTVFREGKVRDYPLEIRHKDGRVTPVLYNASIFRDEAGKVAGVFAAARDVTERKRAEGEILRLNAELEERVKQRTAALERANKELEAFSYSVSHDLRAPLRAVDGFSQILIEDHGPRLDEEGRRVLGVVRQGVAQMARLIDDLLAFSRMGRQELLKKPADMRDVVEAALETLASARAGRRVAIEIGDLPPCEGDAAMLRQVWINLLGNALKFSRANPEAHIEIGAARDDGQDVYWIKDDGAGFDMAYAEKLFKVFQRLHSAAEFEGTGIGLAIVARIVERHGGRIWAEGVPGRGAKFSFTLGGRTA